MALQTYQEWFARHSASERIFRFMPCLQKPQNLRAIDRNMLERILDEYDPKPPAESFVSYAGYPSLEQRRQIAVDILLQWSRILQRQKKAVSKERKWDLLFRNREFLSLGYFMCLFDLLSLKRQSRTNPGRDILEQAMALLDAQLEFIDALLLRVRHLNPCKDEGEPASAVATGSHGA
jgi:hypothetical protein